VAKRDQKRARGAPRRRDRTRRSTHAARYVATLQARSLTRSLLIVAGLLLSAHGLLALYNYQSEKLPWLLWQLFDVDQENNLPTWFSEFLLLLASGLLWFCASTRRAAGDRWSGHWTVLAVGFLLLAVDEVAGIHESINSIIVMSWAIPAGIAALGIGFAFIPFLLALPRRTGLHFALAGAAYLAGAGGLEVVGNEMVGQRLRDTLGYKMTTLAEESLEILAVIFFIHALLVYMRGEDEEELEASLDVR
jgi:uncharacterized integral membrane protein